MISRTFSAGIGLLTAAIVASVLWYLQHIGWLTIASGRGPTFIAAVGIGVCVAFVVGMLLQRVDVELDRLCTHIENLSRRGDYIGTFESRLGLGCVVEAVGAATERMRGRIDQLSAQRHELEMQRRISEAEAADVRAALDAMSDGVLVTNAFDEIALANDAALAILGIDRQTLGSGSIDRSISNPTLLRHIREMREAGLPSTTFDNRRRVEIDLPNPQTGRRNNYLATLAAVIPSGSSSSRLSHRDEVGVVVVVLRDVTREKAIAEQKSDFVSSVSHELRTPLSSISAYLEMLIDGEASDDDSRREFYGIMQGEVHRLSRLIENLLNISRIESGAATVQRELISLSQVVGEVLDVMAPQARAKRVSLNGVGSPKFAQVFADRDLINQAVMNVIGNAIKYTPEGGRVDVAVELRREKQRVELSVRDSGIGIPESDIPHLFDKFYRVNDHKNIAAGTGLGLNLVKQIIETVHGGAIRVESKAGEGSTFTLTLPIAENDY